MLNLDTPVLIIHEAKLEENIREMAEFAGARGINLRPHIKAHKSPWIAKKQLDYGAGGVTVAKLGEAEVMVDSGIDDIFIAYQIIGSKKFSRLLKLSERARVSVAIDSWQGGELLNNFLKDTGKKIDFLIEVNTGLDRCGIRPGAGVVDLVAKSGEWENLNFRGIFTHAGHVYKAESPDEVERIGKEEGRLMVETAQMIREAGYQVPVVSVGATPTVKYSGRVEGVNEIRPGNYVFYDAIQVGLKVVPPERCALSVLSRVISRPEKERAVIDAGSKVFGLDRGAHGVNLVQGFGLVRDRRGIIIERLSEEHGILSLPPETKLEVGDYLSIIPNHACTVINMFDYAFVETADGQFIRKAIPARGKVL